MIQIKDNYFSISLMTIQSFSVNFNDYPCDPVITLLLIMVYSDDRNLLYINNAIRLLLAMGKFVFILIGNNLVFLKKYKESPDSKRCQPEIVEIFKSIFDLKNAVRLLAPLMFDHCVRRDLFLGRVEVVRQALYKLYKSLLPLKDVVECNDLMQRVYQMILAINQQPASAIQIAFPALNMFDEIDSFWSNKDVDEMDFFQEFEKVFDR